MRLLIFLLCFNSLGMTIALPKVPETNRKHQNIETPPKKEHFIIQNIATETIRVYEKSPKGFHKMILEAPMVVGANIKRLHSVLGVFKIISWHKFYQDVRKLYPSWYDPVLNDLPKPHAPVSEWMMKRGAFGWFTAKIGPRASAQWLHGTRGWGADKQKYVLPAYDNGKRITWESSGCSRVDNETIAFIQHLVSKGSYIIKIYAPEQIMDKNLSRYDEKTKRWSYILTANEIRSSNPESIDRESVYIQGLDSSFYLEEGTLVYKSKPKAKKITNPYSIDSNDFNGVFYPDIGKFKDYKHPRKLKKSGLKTPSFLIWK